MVSYLQFYLDLIATPENVSLLYHLASKGKSVRDAESHAYSVVISFSFPYISFRFSYTSYAQNFYVMCELAQVLIKNRAQAQSWTLPSYPGKVRLPVDILRPLPNAEATNEARRINLFLLMGVLRNYRRF
jgi:sister-chromatid-cohesion protein PDS5